MTKMVTDKQLAFIKDLVGADAYAKVESQVTVLTCQVASEVIDDLKERRRQQRAQTSVGVGNAITRGNFTRTAEPLPLGFHYYGGKVYRVRESKMGNTYATEFVPAEVGNDWSFEYRGKRPFNFLSASSVMTLEDAQAFGRKFGICVRCGAVLTDDVSVEQGLGPVCIKKWGQP